MFRRILLSIIINALIVYLVTLLGPQVGLNGMVLQPAEGASLLLFFVLGALFRVCFDGLKAFLGFMTKPLSRLTLGLSNLIISIGVLYLFAELVNRMDLGVTITMGTILEVVITALIITVCSLLFK